MAVTCDKFDARPVQPVLVIIRLPVAHRTVFHDETHHGHGMPLLAIDGKIGIEFATSCTMQLVSTSTIFDPPQPQPAKIPVLVVEDEPISRRALVALLDDSGYRPMPAASAEEALDLLAQGQYPGLALIDLDLPGMNGLEFIQWLRRFVPQITPVLVTATSRERIDLLRQEHQDILYVRKPIDYTRLLKLIEEHIRKFH
ncbi:MAG: response regulator [Phycisphaerales bacterium]|nr:response regulator [Phycisphaerales bacterium]